MQSFIIFRCSVREGKYYCYYSNLFRFQVNDSAVLNISSLNYFDVFIFFLLMGDSSYWIIQFVKRTFHDPIIITLKKFLFLSACKTKAK